MAMDEEADTRFCSDHRAPEREELLYVLSGGRHGPRLFFEYIVEAQFEVTTPIKRGEGFGGRHVWVKNRHRMCEFFGSLCAEITKPAKRQLECAHHQIPLVLELNKCD